MLWQQCRDGQNPIPRRTESRGGKEMDLNPKLSLSFKTCPKYRSPGYSGRHGSWMHCSSLGSRQMCAQFSPTVRSPSFSGEQRDSCLSLRRLSILSTTPRFKASLSVRPCLTAWRETSWDSGMVSLLFWGKMACSEKLAVSLLQMSLCLNALSAACCSSKRVQ